MLCFSNFHIFSLTLPLPADKSMHAPLSYETRLDGMRASRAQYAARYSNVPGYRKLVDARKRAAESLELLDSVVGRIAVQKKYNEEFKRKYFSDLKRNLS